MRARFAALCREVGFDDLPADAKVGTLRVADQQKVEILRALARDARLIVMDEPTAALTADESARLLQTMRELRDRATTIVSVSHFLGQVLAISDSGTVLRDGALVRAAPAASETPESLVTAMLGRSVATTFPDKRYPAPDGPIILSVRGLS